MDFLNEIILYWTYCTYALAQDTMKLKSTLYVGLILFTLTINMHSFKKTSYKTFLCKSIEIKSGPPQKNYELDYLASAD